jgi:hypothetical protein
MPRGKNIVFILESKRIVPGDPPVISMRIDPQIHNRTLIGL